MRVHGVVRFSAAAAAAALLAACGSDKGGGGTDPVGDYVGLYSTDLGYGTITATISASGSARVSGSEALFSVAGTPAYPASAILKPYGGSNVTLSGSLNNSTLGLTGGGYTLSGTFSNGRVQGDVSGPGGVGVFGLENKTRGPVDYCGTYRETGSSVPDGSFHLVLNNDKTGQALVTSNSGGSGRLLARAKGGGFEAYDPASGLVIATSTSVTATTVAGTFDDHEGTTGTWSGSTSACP